MTTNHIYTLLPWEGRDVLGVDFEFAPNRVIDRIQLTEMLDGEQPLDLPFLAGLDFTVEARSSFDFVNYEVFTLVSRKARLVIEKAQPTGLNYWPARINGQPFYFLLCKNVIDCLDRSASKLEFFKNSDRIMVIREFAFRKDAIPDPSIFCIPERPGTLLLTDTAKQMLDANGLKGYRLLDCENPPPGMMLD